jgi:cytochrome c oxidase assembly protein Cox11
MFFSSFFSFFSRIFLVNGFCLFSRRYFRSSGRETIVSRTFPALGSSLLAPVLYLLGLILLMFGLSYASVPLYQLFCRFYGNGSTFNGGFKSFFGLWPLSSEDLLGSDSKPIGISPELSVGSSSWPSPFFNGVNSGSPLVHNSDSVYLSPSFDSPLLENSNVLVDPSFQSLQLLGSHDVPLGLLKRPITLFLCAENSKDLPWILKPSTPKITIFPGDTSLIFYLAHNLSDDAVTGVATYNITPSRAGIYLNKVQCFCFEEQRLKGHESVELPILFFIDPDFSNDPKIQDIDTITLSYTFYRLSSSKD